MAELNQILVILHVMAAMTWFGTTISAPRRLREMVTAERPVARVLAASLKRQTPMIMVAGLTVFITGVALALTWPGGFAGLPRRYHTALGLTILWMLVGAFGEKPHVNRIFAVVEGDGPIDEAHPHVRKVSMFAGIQHLMFTAILVLMLWRL